MRCSCGLGVVSGSSPAQATVNAQTGTSQDRPAIARPIHPTATPSSSSHTATARSRPGVEKNPTRDHRVRFPTAEQVTHSPPTDKHVLAMLEHMPRDRRLLFVLEQDGGRIGEHIAFTWGDVDVEGSKILARADVVKGRRGRRRPRWLQIPEWLMDILLDTCPPEDRTPERPLFPWLHSVKHPIQAAHKTMRTACSVAGIPHYHPHDLRHRRLSLWHGQGIPAREIGDRAGQRQIAVTLDVYTHTMPLDEVSRAAFEKVSLERFLGAQRAQVNNQESSSHR